MKTGLKCAKCGIETIKVLTKKDQYNPRKGETHHILPRRWFKGKGETIHLCHKCHKEIEAEIDEFEFHFLENTNKKKRIKLPEVFYRFITKYFLEGL